ncbi:hypothetical protein FPOAC2_12826 [Fusarium poae]|uniref:hypothetical protein n=1 Tax=Fusarium poae TaxID=36050 RepID=UPI001CEA9420|nr:hypothetical protein FPOAC1_012483 [Fusarium poae]KAG8667650.1 hypothetical protein FPOAC1_012483 [Fusarium poae]
MSSSNTDQDYRAGLAPRSTLQPTPIYHRVQETSDSEGESNLEDVPLRGGSTDLVVVRRRVNRIMELSVDMYSPIIVGGNSDWALMFHDPFFGLAYRFRMAGGPSVGEPWRFEFAIGEIGEPNTFPTPSRRHFISMMPENQRICATARRTRGQFCQKWVIDVIRDLESQGLIPPGKGTQLSEFLETDQYPNIQVSYNDQLSTIEQERARFCGNLLRFLTFGRSRRRVAHST